MAYKVGSKFKDKYGIWSITGYAGSKNDMYEIRGKSGSKVIDEYTIKKFYKPVKLKRLGEY